MINITVVERREQIYQACSNAGLTILGTHYPEFSVAHTWDLLIEADRPVSQIIAIVESSLDKEWIAGVINQPLRRLCKVTLVIKTK